MLSLHGSWRSTPLERFLRLIVGVGASSSWCGPTPISTATPPISNRFDRPLVFWRALSLLYRYQQAEPNSDKRSQSFVVSSCCSPLWRVQYFWIVESLEFEFEVQFIICTEAWETSGLTGFKPVGENLIRIVHPELDFQYWIRVGSYWNSTGLHYRVKNKGSYWCKT